MNESGDGLEDEHPAQSRQGKRYHKARLIVQLLRKRTGRLLVAIFFLALVFASAGMIQRWFFHAQVDRTTSQELGAWADQVAREIGYKDKWDLKGYRQASITAPGWDIVANDGTIVDIEGITPGLFGKIEPPDESIYIAPKKVVTPLGESWRLYGRKVTGGFVIVGISSPENEKDADNKLLANAAKFGFTLEKATSIGSREVDSVVDYAVVSSTGDLKVDWGGIPLKTNPRALPNPSDHITRLVSNGKSFMLYFEPIIDVHGQHVGTIIIPKDMTVEQEALRVQDAFNWWIVGIAALFAFAIALWLIVLEFLTKNKRITIEDALKVGESRTIEFKSTFQWDVRQNKREDERRLDVLKAIAGFLNTDGGALFIGVTEEGIPEVGNTARLCGLEEDLKEMGGSKDKLQLTLQNLITDRIGSAYSHLIESTLAESGGHCYWGVYVQKSPEPVFVRWKPKGQAREQKIFYVREGPKTTDLDNESTWRYIRNKWG